MPPKPTLDDYLAGFGKWRAEWWEPGSEWQVQGVVRSHWVQNPVVAPFVGVPGRIAALKESCWPGEIIVALDYGNVCPNGVWSYFWSYARLSQNWPELPGRNDYIEPVDWVQWTRLLAYHKEFRDGHSV